MYFSETLGKECDSSKHIPIKALLKELKRMASQHLHNPIKVLENSYIDYLNKVIDACDGWEEIESDSINTQSIDDSEIFEV